MRSGTRRHICDRPSGTDCCDLNASSCILFFFSSWWKGKCFTLLQMEFSPCSGRPGAPGPPSCTRLGMLHPLGRPSQTLRQEHPLHSVGDKGHREATEKTACRTPTSLGRTSRGQWPCNREGHHPPIRDSVLACRGPRTHSVPPWAHRKLPCVCGARRPGSGARPPPQGPAPSSLPPLEDIRHC